MDPLAHTLLGATLAETGLKRLTRFGGLALIVGANAPDVDVVAHLVSMDAALGFRRGWSHGVLALFVLPWLVAGLLLGFDRMQRHRGGRPPPLRFGPLLGLSALGVVSHPLLDWLNTYGIRFLMPFDGRWFYGDSMFIIDPWLWLLLAAAPMLAFSSWATARAFWILLAALATLLILVADVPAPARAVWVAGLAGLLALRLSHPGAERIRAVARSGLVAAGVYIAAMITGTLVAQQQAARWLEAQGTPASHLMAGPVPARPLARDVVALTGDRYVFLEMRRPWDTPRVSHPPLPLGDGPIARVAIEAPSVRGLRQWLRFPAFEVSQRDGGYRVVIFDVRFSRRPVTGLGTTVVDLDEDLRVLEERHSR